VEPRDERQRAKERVVTVAGDRRVARAPPHAHRHRAARLLAADERVRVAVLLAAAFADDEVGRDVRALLDEPLRADLRLAALLVRARDQEHVAGRPLKLDERGGCGGEVTLDVHRAATPDRPVAHDSRERVDAPPLSVHRDDVQV
jgi:hypothetical protein